MTVRWGVWYERRDGNGLDVVSAGWMETVKGDPKLYPSRGEAEVFQRGCVLVQFKGETFEVREYAPS